MRQGANLSGRFIALRIPAPQGSVETGSPPPGHEDDPQKNASRAACAWPQPRERLLSREQDLRSEQESLRSRIGQNRQFGKGKLHMAPCGTPVYTGGSGFGRTSWRRGCLPLPLTPLYLRFLLQRLRKRIRVTGPDPAMTPELWNQNTIGRKHRSWAWFLRPECETVWIVDGWDSRGRAL